MNRRRSRPATGRSLEMESLEGRIVLSAAGHAAVLRAAGAGIVGRATAGSTTQTSMKVTAGTLGQPITFNVTVKGPAAAGAPVGTVTLTEQGSGVIGTLTLSPTTTNNPRLAASTATGTLTASPGGPAYFFGRHKVTAAFTPDGATAASSTTTIFNVRQPRYTRLANGVKVATIIPGTGPEIQAGQTANVYYTGYLVKTGKIFDASVNHDGMLLSFRLGGGQLIPGFDAGTAGMKVGESRLIQIPPSQAYGSQANGVIPANSTLLFEVTLHSIS